MDSPPGDSKPVDEIAVETLRNNREICDARKEKKLPYLPPCRVCGSVASGFHYGVNTCEACKGFFRRCLARKTSLQSCTKGGKCAVQLDDRNSCPPCRYDKCMQVGMSKSAIKTGRYTHQKRTNDTIEIKQGYMTPSAVTSQSSTGSQNSQSSPEGSTSSADKPVDLSSGACSLPSIPKPLQQAISPLQTPESSEQGELLKQLSDAWRACFKDTTCMFEQKEFVDSLVHDMMKANNMQCLDHIITYNGHSATEEELKCIKKITEQTEVLKTIERLNSSVTGDMMWKLPDCRVATRQLLECWSTNVDRFIRNVVQFAKKVPGYSQLPVEDQINLIKSGRPELAALIKFKHFNMKFDAWLDYHSETGVMTVFPNRILRGMFLSVDHDNSEHMWLFTRSLKLLSSLNPNVDDLATLCAIVLLSPDREDITAEGKEAVSKIQAKLIPVLHHSMNINHPGDRMALPKFLMILPLLRQLNESNNQALVNAQQMYNPELSPLLQEVLPKVGSQHKLNKHNAETTKSSYNHSIPGQTDMEIKEEAR